MSREALLIGNGLNRAADAAAWEDLLAVLSDRFEVPPAEKASNFPLAYERIYYYALSQGRAKGCDVKAEIARSMRPLADNALIRRFADLPADAILTTNYDYNLELAIQSAFNENKHRSSTPEKKHSLFRHTEIDGRRIWHIHGEKKYPQTICVGYEQYCAYLSRIHAYLTKPREPGQRPYLQHMLLHQMDDSASWPELFFTHNVHIVGLTLSFMEIELWWLFSYRRQLMLTRPDLKIGNEIHYYYPDGKCDPEQLSLMDSMGIELHPYPLINRNWRRMYGRICDDLERKTGRG